MWASSSSSSSTSHNPTFPIEEVWNDVILPSDPRHPSAAAAGLILQDLFPKEPPIAASRPPPVTFTSTQHHFRSLLLQPHSDAGNRRLPPESQTFSGDRGHKRMMKNRVSAARSRARKQAYTMELESQVSLLREENANLKKQQQVCIADGEKCEDKRIIHRTTSAPF